MFTSVFAGLGFVHLAAVVDLAEPPAQFADASEPRRTVTVLDVRTAGFFVVLLALVAGLSVVQVPVKTGQIVTDGEAYETAAWMDEYADERGWEYPDSYVLSEWGTNRMYNYFVNGNSRSYTFTKRMYTPFVTGTSVEDWYEQLHERVGFVIITNREGVERRSIHTYLHRYYGGTDVGLEGGGRFRALYESDSGDYKVFTPVEGALIVGQTTDDVGRVRSSVSLPTSSFTYDRNVSTTDSGWYAVRVPYPSTYSVTGDRTVSVSERDVLNGGFVGDRRPNATWQLDSGTGEYVFDSTGGNHGYIGGAQWDTSGETTALSFDGDSFVEVPDGETLDGENGFAVSVRFRTEAGVDYRNEFPFARIVSTALAGRFDETDGFQIALNRGNVTGIVGNGTAATQVVGGNVTDGRWHEAVLVWDGSTVELYLDGELAGSGRYDGTVDSDEPLVFGASSDGLRGFAGSLDQVRYRNASARSPR